MSKSKIFALTSVAILALGLVGCSQKEDSYSSKSTTTTTESTSKTKTVSDYVKGLDSRGLTADNQTAVDVSTLDKKVPATSAVTFLGESGVKMTLLMFKTQDEATSAQAFYSAANMKTHSDQKMLLISDRDMGKDWFGKYQRGIFEQ